MSDFVYDPLVLQALRSQGSSYTPTPVAVPPPPQGQTLEDLYASMASPEVLPPAPVESLPLGQQIAVANMSGPQTLTSFPGARVPFMAPVLPQDAPATARSDLVSRVPEQVEREQPVFRGAVGGNRRPSEAQAGRDQAMSGILGAFDERKNAVGDASGSRVDLIDRRERAQERADVDDMMAQQELADAADDHQAATAKVQQAQREDAEFVRNFEPRDRRTIGQRAMGAIAVVLAGFADAQTGAGGGQPNAVRSALGIINQSIDRDIDLQQRMLENRKTAMAARNTELGQMRERYGDTTDSIKMARAIRIEQYQRELSGVAAEGANVDAAAAAKDAIGQLELQKQKFLFDVNSSRFEAELKARKGVSLEKRLSIEGKMLENEKKRQELAAGPDGEKLSADERKVQRQLGAVRPAAERLDKMLRKGETPYLGVRDGTQSIPDALVPNENIQYRNDVKAVAGQALRDDSGAVLGPAELSDKLERMGVFSGSAAMRAQGLKDLQYEYESRLNRGQPAKETPASAARSRLRAGAAR